MSEQILDKILAKQNKQWSGALARDPIIDVYLRNVRVRSEFKILETGCGTGLDTLIFAENTELRRKMSKNARKRADKFHNKYCYFKSPYNKRIQALMGVAY